jgi:methylenetetrahydrofolate reductase (NADPH)
MAFTNVDGLRKMAALNATRIPDELDARLEGVAGEPRRVRELAVEVCTALIAELLDGGAPGVHLYTMNFPTAAREIWANLGLAAHP